MDGTLAFSTLFDFPGQRSASRRDHFLGIALGPGRTVYISAESQVINDANNDILPTQVPPARPVTGDAMW